MLVPLAVRFSVSSGCARRRSVSTYAAILVLQTTLLIIVCVQLKKEVSLKNVDEAMLMK